MSHSQLETSAKIIFKQQVEWQHFRKESTHQTYSCHRVPRILGFFQLLIQCHPQLLNSSWNLKQPLNIGYIFGGNKYVSSSDSKSSNWNNKLIDECCVGGLSSKILLMVQKLISWYGEYPVIRTVSHMLGGAGSLSSTASMVWSSSNIPSVFRISQEPISTGKGSSSRIGWAYSSACQEKQRLLWSTWCCRTSIMVPVDISKCIILSWKILLLYRLMYTTEKSSTQISVLPLCQKSVAFTSHYQLLIVASQPNPPGHVGPLRKQRFYGLIKGNQWLITWVVPLRSNSPPPR